MSNDLISRSALMQSLRNNVLVDVTPNLEQAIAEQPTAFDVDKVMEQFEKEIREYGKVHSLARFEWLAALEMIKAALNISGGDGE